MILLAIVVGGVIGVLATFIGAERQIRHAAKEAAYYKHLYELYYERYNTLEDRHAVVVENAYEMGKRVERETRKL